MRRLRWEPGSSTDHIMSYETLYRRALKCNLIYQIRRAKVSTVSIDDPFKRDSTNSLLFILRLLNIDIS